MLLRTLFTASILFLYTIHAEDANLTARDRAASTVSSGWQAVFSAFPDPTKSAPMPAPDDVASWQKIHDMMEKVSLKGIEKRLASYGVDVKKEELGGVNVYVVRPDTTAKLAHKVIVYTHGGAYTMLSAASTLECAALVAENCGVSVISVDYTNPPKAKWKAVINEVVSVYRALLKEGYKGKDIVLFGDSAGGALATATILKLRSLQMPLPSGLVLWSPWADITQTGDSYMTLKEAEPRFIYERVLKPSADAYADPKEQKNPYVSPVYAHYDRAFPPVLIQGGTREIFLSNFVRLYQAMDQAGVDVKLDLYEGMPHVFQTLLPTSAESRTALKKMAKFVTASLRL